MNRATSLREFSFRAGASATWNWPDVLLKCSDAALAGVVFVAPLFMGGRHPVGKLVYVCFACAAALAWCLRQCLSHEATWRKSGAEWLIMAVVVVLLVQLVPLSAGTLRQVSPGIAEMLPLWQEGSQTPVHFKPWQTISVVPRETRAGLVVFLAHALVFLTVVQRIGRREDVERLLLWIALAAGGMAALGLAQYFFGNGKFLWVYLHPSRDTNGAAKGMFHNQNHFAQFLALGLGPLIWLARKRFEPAPAGQAAKRKPEFDWRRAAPSAALVAALVAVAFGGLLTLSRGGVVALFAAAAVCAGIYAWKGLFGARAVLGVGAAGVVAAIAILAYGYEPLTRSLATIQESQSLEDVSHARSKLWGAMLQATSHHWVLGTGVGSHIEVYPTYLSEYFDSEFTHGENGYLQILLETGVVGAGLLLAGIGVAAAWCIRTLWGGDRALVACAAPVTAGLAASLVQSCGDFVWYIPACMSLAVILLACACRLHQLAREEREPHQVESAGRLPRVTWIGATVLLLSLALAMVQDRLAPARAAPHWDSYLALSLRASNQSVWTSDGEVMAPDSPGLTARLLEHLDAAVHCDPNNAVANLRLAVIYKRKFDQAQQKSDNAMDLTQIREAALASNFASRADQDRWLASAIGDNRKYLDRAAWSLRRSLRLSPMEGEAYVYLAEMAFLDGLGYDAKRAYIDQAARLRPYKGMVLIAQGKEQLIDRKIEPWMQSWKRAFHQDPESQQTVVDNLAGLMPAPQLVEYIEPDMRGLGRLFARYRQLNRVDDARLIGALYAPLVEQQAAGEKGAAAARLWSVAATVHAVANELEPTLACMGRAAQAAPGDPQTRRSYAFHLLEAQRFDEAIAQFQWCLRYNPDDESAEAGLGRAMRRGLTPAPVADKSKERPKRY